MEVTPMLAMTALMLTACGPSDTEINKLYPAISVAPEALEFGDAVVDYGSTLELEVINGGQVELVVDSTSWLGQTGAYTVEPQTLTVGARDRATLEVTFLPDNYLDYADTLLITSDDPAFPDGVEVPVTGTGVDAPTPDIQLSSASLDFGEVAEGAAGTAWFDIQNVGDASLLIDTTSQLGSGAFTVQSDLFGSTLAPGDSTTVVVLYQPTTSDGDSGELTVVSNDPDEPEVTVHVVGNGGTDAEYPVADISGPSSTAPLDHINLDGSGSYDPSGESIVAYHWRLVSQPSGSTTELDDSNAEDQADIFLDLAGDYRVELQVENTIGLLSAPATWTTDAIPEDRIHVEMSWDTSATDLDLHLVQSDPDNFFDSELDTCYCNPNPDWGSSGSSDDPTLDLDDVLGFGPENINIEQPADGDYWVMVHFFDGNEATNVTVKLYLDGVFDSEYTEVMERNELWQVGYVRWPDSVFVEDQVLGTTGTRSCQ